MSTFDPQAVQELLTPARLGSYRDAVGGHVARAVRLYDWNSEVGGAFFEDLGRLEVVLRNAMDKRLVEMGASRGWTTPWYRRRQLFSGKHGVQALKDIDKAIDRANRRGPEVHGKVIAELNFGFWRYLSAKSYLTTLWVPALNEAFPDIRRPPTPAWSGRRLTTAFSGFCSYGTGSLTTNQSTSGTFNGICLRSSKWRTG